MAHAALPLAAVDIGLGGWILVILLLAWLASIVVRRVRANRSSEDEEEAGPGA